MTTHTKGPPPATASSVSAHPDHTPGRVVTLRKAAILAALAALLVGVLSAAAATYLAGMPDDGELEGRAETLTAQIDSLTTEVDGLTAEVDTLTVRADDLATENADLSDTLAGARAQVDSLGDENALLRTQIADMTGHQPVVAEVTFGTLLRVDRYWTNPRTWDEGPRSSTFDRVALADAFVLVVDVTVTNPDADKDAYISSREFRLKGLDGTVFPLAERSPVAPTHGFRTFPQGMPGGRIYFEHMTLGPSETAKASLVFYVSPPVTEFTITYPAPSTITYPPSWFDHRTTTTLSL
jgi:cell division protein FtsB